MLGMVRNWKHSSFMSVGEMRLGVHTNRYLMNDNKICDVPHVEYFISSTYKDNRGVELSTLI